ncbi:arabinosyltransferase EmbB [Mycobacterium ulcerans]|uniref:Integral membrane indolylacetylinositol arabinosyltransferase EmbB n=1 Tax=Mycobacterium ulcerans (strain Agy99) TaxID=362242 RepID=A0PWY7_MYCUA|nr:arabinosyltransferase EmbB [Mycobacterium ulcerans]ABL06856.1 integral membrane indolylacetylinositol arabinosyltransferase EmbB [Mycobacterium ulcerans Agy99]MEB3906377.1 arabinosyltransferase EmbB [Mycobacterium ulcerans]MEB3910548.1 arabinosyltransferase EmbB [Mycobacterium ulcerans]MEB3920799.1 arabinosyltransferase EmbB [Mycobacterium ulcerans]MEB3924886.1 arabinosyltransferase EmbB [Mycobacterium ulcerans]
MSVTNETEQATAATTASAREVRVTRWVATIAGLIGFVLSVATPLLPLVQTTAMLNWPQNGQLNSVTAPLISLTPVNLTASMPCSVVRDMPAKGGVVLGTAPKQGKDANLQALFVVVNSKRVNVTDRNVVILSVPREQVDSPQCERIEISSTHAGTFATFVGVKDPSGAPLRSGYPDPNLRPQIVGVFTDLTGPAPDGLRLSATIDTRFSTTPTTLKLLAIIGAILATTVALIALWRLDRLDGRRLRSLFPANWRTFTLVDAAMIFGFLLWHVIGANSSDDGYILGMARVADHAGYMSNYFRWFGSPEDPFGWYYNLLALMTHVSDASIWMRLPDLFAGLVCWLLLSREVLPRLGPAVAASKPANWAAAMVLLTAWMPFNNGLRPEGIIALGSLVTYVLIERSMRYGRLTPAALAIISAAFTLGVQPTGLIAVAALVAGGRPILRILVKRRRQVGALPLLSPMLAAGTIILTVVFADQNLSTMFEATRVRGKIGPSQAWYTENLRYYYLILPTVDGSLSRRFGFLITALCLFTAVFIMLRRKRVAGVARGPAWRLMGVIFGTMFFLMFTPTKWVHHFGLFAAVGAAMAALTTVLVSPTVLRWSRNRMAFLAALLFTLALCWATTNGWWYVSSYGVPFNSAMPKIAGITVSTIFFVLFALAVLYAAWLHFAPRGSGEGRLTRALTTAPVPIAAGFMAVVFVASMGIGILRQYPTYSNGWANLRAFTGGCGLADDLLVEPDTNAGFMTPLPGDYGPLGPLGGENPVGFSPNGVPDHTVAEAMVMKPNQPGTDYDWDQPVKLKTPGINGSTVPLPYQLDPARVPLAGTYAAGSQQQSKLTSAWYHLPKPDDGHPLVVVTAAGKIAGNSVLHGYTPGQTVVLEYAKPGPGPLVAAGRMVPDDLFGEQPKAWRNLRFARDKMPADAVAVRVVAEDLSLTPEDWIALTPPRVPDLRSLQEYVGSTQPVLLDWAVGLAFPCQQPMLHVNGVTEIPKFRITPDYNAKKLDTDTWEDGVNGGLLGITDLLLRAHVMATYLSRDWARDWGSLRQFETLVDAPPAQLDLGTATHSGLWSPGKIRIGP